MKAYDKQQSRIGLYLVPREEQPSEGVATPYQVPSLVVLPEQSLGAMIEDEVYGEIKDEMDGGKMTESYMIKRAVQITIQRLRVEAGDI
jgi:hypothetical protein